MVGPEIDADLESKLDKYSVIEMQPEFIPSRRKKPALLSIRMKGYLTLFSGVVWMLFLGSHFMVGPLSTYVLSYFPESKMNEAQSLFPTITMVCIFSNFLGSHLIRARLLKPQLMIILAATVGIGGIFISSYVTNWQVFRILFPICYGFPVGFTNMIHVYLSWCYIPGSEGLLAGIVNAGNGCGNLLFTYLSQTTANPDGVEPIKVTSANPHQKPYPPSVAGHFPLMLRLLCTYWTIIALVALLTIQDLPKDKVTLNAIEINQVI